MLKNDNLIFVGSNDLTTDLLSDAKNIQFHVPTNTQKAVHIVKALQRRDLNAIIVTDSVNQIMDILRQNGKIPFTILISDYEPDRVRENYPWAKKILKKPVKIQDLRYIIYAHFRDSEQEWEC